MAARKPISPLGRAQFVSKFLTPISSAAWLLGSVAFVACGGSASLSLEPAKAAPSPAPAPAVAMPAPVLVAQLDFANPSNFQRRKESLYLSYYELGLAPEDARVPTLAVLRGESLVPSQAVDSDGDGRKDGLLALVDLAAAESATLSVVSDEQLSKQHFSKLTQAVLAKAFPGEVVPTAAELARQEGRAYEPADVLLRRLAARRSEAAGASGRAAAATKPPTRRAAARPRMRRLV